MQPADVFGKAGTSSGRGSGLVSSGTPPAAIVPSETEVNDEPATPEGDPGELERLESFPEDMEQNESVSVEVERTDSVTEELDPETMRKMVKYSKILYRSAKDESEKGRRSVRKYSKKLWGLMKGYSRGEGKSEGDAMH
jgi:hypothetical protein